MKTHHFEVIVGNVGTVYSGADGKEADDTYEMYRENSIAGVGGVGGEAVTLLVDGEVAREHYGEIGEES